MGLFSFLGFSKNQKPSANAQQVLSPSDTDRQRLVEQRSVLERYLADEESRAKYQSSAGKLGLLRALLDQNVFQPTQTYELQCMGVVLGDVFVQELGLEWVTVQDEYGTDPAIRVPGTSIILFPLTMISKRIENRDRVDVFELFNGVAQQVESLKRQGE